jgi:hypothetical protein
MINITEFSKLKNVNIRKARGSLHSLLLLNSHFDKKGKVSL